MYFVCVCLCMCVCLCLCVCVCEWYCLLHDTAVVLPSDRGFNRAHAGL